MTRKLVGIVGAAVLALGAMGWACGDTPVTPKSQCQSGSRKIAHKKNKTTLYECHNNEWIKVQCFNGSSKVVKGVYYYCRSNEWVKR